jgi:small conductance mechanosensitive channel
MRKNNVGNGKDVKHGNYRNGPEHRHAGGCGRAQKSGSNAREHPLGLPVGRLYKVTAQAVYGGRYTHYRNHSSPSAPPADPQNAAKIQADPTLHHFMLSIFGIVLYLVLGTMVLAILVPDAVGGLIALMSVFGLAISLAVKDSLANLAGGISVLFTKPFALGDYVQINSTEGTVEEIRLNYTVLKTFDNKVVHIPNGDVAKAQIVNFTCEPTRRLDITFSISYQDDFQKAQELIRSTVNANPMALDNPEPLIRVTEHASSAILICCRVWCKTPDYWPLKFDLLEEVKCRFDQSGISIPYNQLDVHIAQ